MLCRQVRFSGAKVKPQIWPSDTLHNCRKSRRSFTTSHTSLFTKYSPYALIQIMSKFITDIWNSVFEPGTNQSVLIATYSSFAALQATLFGLLLATRSWHFVFLSVICGCLWGAVAWFVRELEAVKKMEAEADRLRELRKANGEDSASEEENRKKR